MAKRKHINHGEKRKVSESKIYGACDGGAQSLSSSNADLVKITTAATSAGTQVTLNLSDIYEGKEVIIDFDSGDACDTLTVKLNGTSSSVDVATAITANQRSLSKVVVLDVTDGSEKGSQHLLNANIT